MPKVGIAFEWLNFIQPIANRGAPINKKILLLKTIGVDHSQSFL